MKEKSVRELVCEKCSWDYCSDCPKRKKEAQPEEEKAKPT